MYFEDLLSVMGWFIIGFIAFWYLTTTIVITRQKTVVLIERFGKFVGTRHPGLSLKLPFPFHTVVARVSTQLRELRHEIDVKTLDNAYVRIPVAVQYKVTNPELSHYELENPDKQLTSYVLNTVKSDAATMTLDELFSSKNTIEQAVATTLEERMTKFGFEIQNVLVDEPQPDEAIRKASNAVIASHHLKAAATNNAAADRIKIVAAAEANMESKILQGQGIAGQRKAIAEGLSEAMALLVQKTGMSEAQVMGMLMMTNQFDTIRDAANSKSNLILMNSSGNDALQQMSNMAAGFESLAKSHEDRHVSVIHHDEHHEGQQKQDTVSKNGHDGHDGHDNNTVQS